MRDGDLRDALHRHLQHEHREDADTRTVDELSVCGMARIDVAVINGSFAAYELKSARDRLTRLASQVVWFSKVADTATLVVAERHLDRAVPQLPPWWGVIAALEGPDVRLEPRRPPGSNPAIDPLSLACLLWRSEALTALDDRGLAKGLRAKPRSALWSALATDLSLDELRQVVRDALKTREGWRAD